MARYRFLKIFNLKKPVDYEELSVIIEEAQEMAENLSLQKFEGRLLAPPIEVSVEDRSSELLVTLDLNLVVSPLTPMSAVEARIADDIARYFFSVLERLLRDAGYV